MLMRLEWTDGDATKSWLGCDWCNGETKEVYADYHNKYQYGAFTTGDGSGQEAWYVQAAGGDQLNMERFYWWWSRSDTTSLYGKRAYIYVNSAKDHVSESGVQSSGLGILTAGDVPGPGDYYLLAKQKTNSYTDASGITYTWTEGSGW